MVVVVMFMLVVVIVGKLGICGCSKQSFSFSLWLKFKEVHKRGDMDSNCFYTMTANIDWSWLSRERGMVWFLCWRMTNVDKPFLAEQDGSHFHIWFVSIKTLPPSLCLSFFPVNGLTIYILDQIKHSLKGKRKKPKTSNRDVLFEFHLKFWNTSSIGIPVRSLL